MKQASRPLKVTQLCPTGNPDFFLAIDNSGKVWIGEMDWTKLPPTISWIEPTEIW